MFWLLNCKRTWHLYIPVSPAVTFGSDDDKLVRIGATWYLRIDCPHRAHCWHIDRILPLSTHGQLPLALPSLNITGAILGDLREKGTCSCCDLIRWVWYSGLFFTRPFFIVVRVISCSLVYFSSHSWEK
jgi:hypothetical protein